MEHDIGNEVLKAFKSDNEPACDGLLVTLKTCSNTGEGAGILYCSLQAWELLLKAGKHGLCFRKCHGRAVSASMAGGVEGGASGGHKSEGHEGDESGGEEEHRDG